MTNQLVFLNNNNEVVTDSLMVSEVFNKRHDNVIREVEKLIFSMEEKGNLIFEESFYEVGNGRKYKKYSMTKDGFTLLVMGLTGKQALKFKMMYIEQFNKMEEHIRSQEKPKSALDQLQRLLLEGTVELKERVEDLEYKVEKRITLDYQQQRMLQNVVEGRVRHLWNNGTPVGRLSKKQLFHRAYRRLKDRYGTGSYKDIFDKDFEEAMNYIKKWQGE